MKTKRMAELTVEYFRLAANVYEKIIEIIESNHASEMKFEEGSLYLYEGRYIEKLTVVRDSNGKGIVIVTYNGGGESPLEDEMVTENFLLLMELSQLFERQLTAEPNTTLQ